MSDAMPDGYDFMETLSANPVFRVTRAAATGEMGRLCVLRQLYPAAPDASRAALRSFAERAAGGDSPLLNLPVAALESPDGSLALRYAHRPPPVIASPELPPLDTANLPSAMARCRALADALTALHGRGFRHGCLTPDAVWVTDGGLRLDVPGYAALLDAGDALARAGWTERLAPEVRAGGAVTEAADVYSFAGVVAAWLPEVRDTPWHRQAADPDPTRRFPTPAAALPGLLRLLETCASEPPTVERRPLPATPVPKVPVEPPAAPPRPLSSVRLDPASAPSPVGSSDANTPAHRAVHPEGMVEERIGLPDLRDDSGPRWLLGLLVGVTLVLVVLALSMAPVLKGLLGR